MVTSNDFNTHFHPEILEQMVRGQEPLVARLIASAEAEVKSYISRYEVAVLFSGTLPEEVTGHLKNVIKDVAAWHLVKLANPNIDLPLFRTNYEDALAWLKLVQSGKADPPGWPYPQPQEGGTGSPTDSVQWGSNKKRSQFF